MDITNCKEAGKVLHQRLSHLTIENKKKIAKKAGIQVRMLYRIMQGQNTKVDTLLKLTSAAKIKVTFSKSHLKNGG